jgi:hypothetical protein
MCPDDTTRTIPLSNGLSALVDAADYEMLSHFKWHVRNLYPRTTLRSRNVSRSTGMQRMILLPAPDEVVDHINGDPLDNRRCNLRACTHSQNMMNRDAAPSNSSGYKGVYWHRSDRCWRAVMRKEYRGSFADPIDAALAYDLAALSECGAFARLNFLQHRKES